MLMSGIEYRESLRRLRPVVWCRGERVENVADHPAFAPGVAAIARVHDLARREALRPLLTAERGRVSR